MAIKEEADVKAEQDEEKDELAALDALEKEASEFNKVIPTTTASKIIPLLTLLSALGCRDRSNPQSLQTRCVKALSSPLQPLPTPTFTNTSPLSPQLRNPRPPTRRPTHRHKEHVPQKIPPHPPGQNLEPPRPRCL